MENKNIDYWKKLARYDLKVAKSMFKSKHFIYVGFMCHQSIEKMLKAIYVKEHVKVPPYTHNLLLLAEKAKIIKQLSQEQQTFLADLDPLNIQARYPSHKEAIHKLLTEQKAKEILKKTEEFLKWLKAKVN